MQKKSLFEKLEGNTAYTGDNTNPISLECVYAGEEFLNGMETVAGMCEGAGGRG